MFIFWHQSSQHKTFCYSGDDFRSDVLQVDCVRSFGATTKMSEERQKKNFLFSSLFTSHIVKDTVEDLNLIQSPQWTHLRE